MIEIISFMIEIISFVSIMPYVVSISAIFHPDIVFNLPTIFISPFLMFLPHSKSSIAHPTNNLLYLSINSFNIDYFKYLYV